MSLPEYYGTPNRLLAELQKEATKDTARYFMQLDKMPEFIPSNNDTITEVNSAKAELRLMASNFVSISGFVAEYGVNKGESFKQLCRIFSDDTVFGFDAFDGLPEQWHGNIDHSNLFKYDGKIPFVIPENGKIVPGWFDDTIPNFDYGDSQAKFLHIDCDIYSSTVTVLENVKNYIKPGTIIVFDDYCNYPGWRQGEFKAWKESGFEYEYLYVSGMTVAIKVV